MKYLLYYCFFIIIIITFAYFNSSNDIEEFTPKLKEMYRPYIRHARIHAEGFYTKQKKMVSNLLKKIGIA
jgi:hypothetical protein